MAKSDSPSGVPRRWREGEASYLRHEDDDWIDEVRIVTVPRWKESEISGDEWRFSQRIELYRKGQLLATSGAHKMRDAVAMLPGLLIGWGGGSHIGGAFDEEPERTQEFWNAFCFNPGCPEQATFEFRRKHHYCREGEAHDREWRIEHLRFCERHKHRGDCGFNDADANYEVVALRMPDGTWKPVAEGQQGGSSAAP